MFSCPSRSLPLILRCTVTVSVTDNSGCIWFMLFCSLTPLSQAPYVSNSAVISPNFQLLVFAPTLDKAAEEAHLSQSLTAHRAALSRRPAAAKWTLGPEMSLCLSTCVLLQPQRGSAHNTTRFLLIHEPLNSRDGRWTATFLTEYRYMICEHARCRFGLKFVTSTNRIEHNIDYNIIDKYTKPEM